jgi:dienelactone hydrolase
MRDINSSVRRTALIAGVLATWSCGFALAQGTAEATGSGPYPALMEADPGLATHTVYRPQSLDNVGGRKLPIVAFGNGACRNAGSMYRSFLTEVASHGFLVVAVGPIGFDLSTAPPQPASPPAAQENRPARSAAPTALETKPAQVHDAVDWAVAENARKDSRYYGKLDVDKIALMGQSCGGLQALEIARDDRRVDTVVMLNSGIFADGRTLSGFTITKADLPKLRMPIAYFTGGKSDGASVNAADDFKYLVAPTFMANMEVGHMATYAQPNGGKFAPAPVAWLKWQLRGDKAAEKMFVGKACGLCTDPQWTVEWKNFK